MNRIVKKVLVKYLNYQLRKEERKALKDQQWNKVILILDALNYLECPSITTGEYTEKAMEYVRNKFPDVYSNDTEEGE